MFLHILLLVLGVHIVQQPTLGSSESLPVSKIQGIEHGFTMRHILVHGSGLADKPLLVYDTYTENIAYAGEDDDEERGPLRPLRLRSRLTQVYQLADSQSVLVNSFPVKPPDASRESDDVAHDWRLEHVLEPDVCDKETVLNLAKISSDAYLFDETAPDWFNMSAGLNLSLNFGWQDNRLRGHVFADARNSTVIIAIKGTSATPGDDTVENDRLNDNLLFSCCCASQQPIFGPVCNCRTDTYLCDQACLTYELRQPDRYYALAQEIYTNVTAMYPNSDIWLTGHSMGGAMSSLLGLTFGRPAITFEAPPSALPAHRLGLPLPPGASSHQAREHTAGYHFGHTADPIYMGACNGITSACYWSGYAMDSQCFTGLRCVYDTVEDKGWHLSIDSHRIKNVIRDVIEAYDEPAKCEADAECVDCNNWYFDKS